MRQFAASLALAAVLALPAAARAADLPGVTAGVSAGTLGVGPEVNLRYPGSPFGLRLGMDYLDVGTSFRSGGVSYKANARLLSGGATVDYYPFKETFSGFRMSLGARVNGNQATVSATPSGVVSLGGHSYLASDVGTLSGRATYNPVAPYVGVGYSLPLFSQLVLSLDGGVLYQGNGNLNLSSTGGLSGSAAFQQDLASASARVRRDMGYAEFYPVAMVTLGWHF